MSFGTHVVDFGVQKEMPYWRTQPLTTSYHIRPLDACGAIPSCTLTLEDAILYDFNHCFPYDDMPFVLHLAGGTILFFAWIAVTIFKDLDHGTKVKGGTPVFVGACLCLLAFEMTDSWSKMTYIVYITVSSFFFI